MASNKLFPTPSLSPSVISPRTFPGITPESTQTLKKFLSDDFDKHHVFFNDMGFHNHLAHHLLAIWALGANEDELQKAYDVDAKMQRPAFNSPEKITKENFHEHLGDEKFYHSYLEYFIESINHADGDLGAVFEEHVFSSWANYGSKNAKGEHPEMLNRFFDSIVHPMIHTGYGLEFGIPGMVAEGLAQTAVHQRTSSPVIPPSVFSNDPVPSVGKLASRLHSVKLTSSSSKSTHAFTIISRLLKDDSIKCDGKKLYDMEKWGETIFKHATDWADFDASDMKAVERKVEEIQFINTLIYAVPGFKEFKEKQKFNADFFSMHLVTSSLFVPSILAYLSPASKHVFLRSYFSVCLAWWISRGKPALDISSFFQSPPPNKAGTDHKEWTKILDHAIADHDAHLCKLQRALAHYSSLYGSRKAGEGDFKETELVDADKIDGTLFLRAAVLTMGRLDGEEFGWDRHGFFQ